MYVENHPYYRSDKPLHGFVILSGKRFDNVQIQYDIFEEYLILEYQERSGRFNKIILNPATTDAFQLDGDYFEKLTLDKKGLLFYQVIKENGATCYIHYRMNLRNVKDAIRGNQNTQYFSTRKRTYYLFFDGEFNSFRNRLSYASLFSGVTKKEIRKFMRHNKIRFSDATPEELAGLLEFSSSEMKSGSGN